MSKYDGMTMNERLYESGMMDMFDEAFKNRDAKKLVNIYIQLGVQKEGAEKDIEEMLEKPRRDS